jgi:hypothetical protein
MKGSILRELILNNAYLRGVQRLRMLGCSEVETGRAELLRVFGNGARHHYSIWINR